MFVVKRELLERRQGGCYTILKIMFPGYVLVESEDIRSFAELARNCKGVYRFLENEGAFQQIADAEMAQIVCLTNEQGLIGVSDVYRDGDSIMVLSGVLNNCVGRIVKFDTHNRRARVEFVFDGKVYKVGLGIRVTKEMSG
jgi:transcriptional antiterminator NusG